MKPTELTTEQQFRLTMVKHQVKNLSLEEAQEYIINLIEQSMLKDSLIREWMNR